MDNLDWTGAATISVDIEFASGFYQYGDSGPSVTHLESPEDFRSAYIRIIGPRPGGPPSIPTLRYYLDLSGLSFDEVRTYTVSVYDPSVLYSPGGQSITDVLSTVSSVRISFQGPDVGSLIGTAYFDNFRVESAAIGEVPEPTTYALFALGALACGHTAHRRRKRMQKRS